MPETKIRHLIPPGESVALAALCGERIPEGGMYFLPAAASEYYFRRRPKASFFGAPCDECFKVVDLARELQGEGLYA